jgi:plastocyanin
MLRSSRTGGLVAMVALVAGCGSVTGSGSSTTLEAQDFKFSPSTLSATAGTQVSITFKNAGTVEHDFSITELKVDTEVEKGDTKTITFTPTASGPATIAFFCKYHKSKGMTGTISVSGANGGGSSPTSPASAPSSSY